MITMVYKEVAVTAASTKWTDAQKVEFKESGQPGFVSDHIMMIAELGTGPVEFSFDGLNTHGKLVVQSTFLPLNLHNFRSAQIWVRGVGDETLKLWAWTRG